MKLREKRKRKEYLLFIFGNFQFYSENKYDRKHLLSTYFENLLYFSHYIPSTHSHLIPTISQQNRYFYFPTLHMKENHL